MLPPIYQEIPCRVLVLVLHLLVSNSRLDKQEGCKWNKFWYIYLYLQKQHAIYKVKSVNPLMLFS